MGLKKLKELEGELDSERAMPKKYCAAVNQFVVAHGKMLKAHEELAAARVAC